MAGFMSGFGPAFGKALSTGVDSAIKSYDDDVKTQMAFALEQKTAFEKAKAADAALVKQAELLAQNVPGAPDEAWKVAYTQLKAGRDEEKVLEELRKGSWSAVKTPEKGPEVEKPVAKTASETAVEASVDAQMEGAMGEPTKAPETAASVSEKPTEEKSFFGKVVDDISADISKPRSERLKEDTIKRIGVDQAEYESWLAGYSSDVDTTLKGVKFTPPVIKDTKDLPNNPKEARMRLLMASPEYAAMTTEQKDAALRAIDEDKSGGIDFGKSLTGGMMSVWANTDEGKEAIASGNVSVILQQASKFNDAFSTTKSSDKPADIDLDDLPNFYYNQWAESEAGKKAIADGDQTAINEAIAYSHTQANTLGKAINGQFGFDAGSVTDLDQIPGLREQYAGNPTVLTQLSTIEGALKERELEKAATSAGPDTVKPVSVFSVGADGNPVFAGTGMLAKDGKLRIGEMEVAPADAARMMLLSADAPVDFEKVGANDWIKTRKQVESSVDLAEAGLRYMATFEDQEYARTFAARTAAGFSGLLSSEIGGLIKVATVLSEDGTEVIDSAKLSQAVMSSPALEGMSRTVRQLYAQELALPFTIARAQGNSGTAMSNQDYKNYYNQLFNSKNIEDVRANIEGIVYNQYNSAITAARGLADNPTSQYVVQGAQWYTNPEQFALANRDPAVVQFIQNSKQRTADLYAGSSYGKQAADNGTSTQAIIETYKAGQPITWTKELAEAYPDLGFEIGSTVQKRKQQ